MGTSHLGATTPRFGGYFSWFARAPDNRVVISPLHRSRFSLMTAKGGKCEFAASAQKLCQFANSGHPSVGNCMRAAATPHDGFEPRVDIHSLAMAILHHYGAVQYFDATTPGDAPNVEVGSAVPRRAPSTSVVPRRHGTKVAACRHICAW